jgi:TM2 domain-containing membrane protein YozV
MTESEDEGAGGTGGVDGDAEDAGTAGGTEGTPAETETAGGGAAAGNPGPDEQYCSSCGEIIKKEAEICPECGVRQKSPVGGSDKDRTAAALLAFLFGWMGAHKFYLDQVGMGLLYLCFFWTLIPGLVALVEGIIYLTKSEEEFERKYGTT